jgi:predicted RNA-binding protein YlqC (UPF0109 family)
VKDLVLLLVEPLVDHPEEVEIEIDGDELRLWVHDDDRRRIIGRRGKTIRALRQMLRAHGEKFDHRANLVLVEDPEEGDEDPDETDASTEVHADEVDSTAGEVVAEAHDEGHTEPSVEETEEPATVEGADDEPPEDPIDP